MKKYEIVKAVSKILFVNLLVVAQFNTASAQNTESSAFSLQQAIDYALKNQVGVINAELDIQLAKAEINERTAVGLPQIDGSANINRFIEIPTQFLPAEFLGGEPGTYAPVQFGQNYSASAGANARQMLFDASYFLGLRASKAYVELSRKNFQQTKIETVVNVSKAYYFVLVAEERLKQLNSDITRLAKLKDDTKALFDNGFVEKIDYDRIVLNFNLLESARKQTERIVANSYRMLKFQIGMQLETPLTLSENISAVQIDPALYGKDSVNYDARIEYAILKTQYRLAGLNLKRLKATRWPTLDIFGNYSANASRNDFNIFDTQYRWYPSSIVGVSLAVPLFGGFKINYQVKQAKLNLLKAENSFFMLEQGIQLEQKNALTSLQNNFDQLDTQNKNRELAREIARVSKIKYDQGLGSNLEVINAEASLREAETNYYTALLETIIAQIDLDKSIGNIKY